ncbi:MAG: hypothetical protein COA71_13750 [SAR86 cluster bacterium]|uniref:Uncharacterized protein n=1 Tax=SAR86 cluster bacterium TaxID=2030880 RepID=A0A2A5C804_9GAMM|nr:MAG: hypothetical protein COA71_13750 [SAR86 cluster bacterium]
MEEKKAKFLTILANKLAAFYVLQKEGKPLLEERGNVKGYMEAALRLGAISEVELQKVISEQHNKAFGKALRQRHIELFDSQSEEFDWDYFDTPIWKRE